MTTTKVAIREVAEGVWTFSCPFARFNIFPVGGRSTAIKLQDGGVWVLASTPLTEDTKAKLNELGPVKYIVGADAVHHLFLGPYKKEYPDAKLIAVEEAIQKKTKEGLTFDGSWGKDPEGTKYGFEDDIQHLYFSGFRNKDAAFLHRASKSLIVADLIFNLPATEQYSTTGSSGRFPIFGDMNPFSSFHKNFLWMAGVDKEAMKRDATIVSGWNFDRIIPCHGDVIETNGKEAWKAAFSKYFQ
ncbi:uncharacterized protein BXZ73DRAFT_75081 [Epithele typhae]|uniref:uncharacterized protein n=1 Tax=Epithele typhae TaxID=378194 RepID=UPI0020079A01|nr:uncharacterized protein BXZ73DRAFT_75081 [Epithele typhae]KAH9941106.1 hypothetical protein BXZ73DRAFT_75081 [Epithele typhae]